MSKDSCLHVTLREGVTVKLTKLDPYQASLVSVFVWFLFYSCIFDHGSLTSYNMPLKMLNPQEKIVLAMLMRLRTALCFPESPSSSPRVTSADNSPASTQYLKMARKGGGRKGMVCCSIQDQEHNQDRKTVVYSDSVRSNS